MFVTILGTERTCQTDGTWNGTAPTLCMTPMPFVGMGTQCIMYNKDNMGPLQVPEDGTPSSDYAIRNSKQGYQGCHEKLFNYSNGWAKISSHGACVISSAYNSWHRRCYCKSHLNVDCKAMCAGDSGCRGYVDKVSSIGGGYGSDPVEETSCQWATISNTC